MAFDFDKFVRSSEFSFKLISVGVVRCKSLTSALMLEARRYLKAPEAEGKELARWLLGELANRPTVQDFKESDPIEGDRLTTEQLASVTDPELESFSEHVLEKNFCFTKSHGSEEIKRVAGQSACDFLAHAISHRGKAEKSQIDRIIQSATNPLFTESTLDSIKRSLNAANEFEDLIQKYSPKSPLESIKESIAASDQTGAFAKVYAADATLSETLFSQAQSVSKIPDMSPFHIPKNPIHETNEILENLTGQIEDMRPLVAQGAEMIRSMNETAIRMQADYIANAARTDRQTRNATMVAVFSLIVSAIGIVASLWFSYQTYADGKVAAKESKDQGKAFEDMSKSLMTVQHEDRLLLTKAIADLKLPVPVGKK